MRRDRLITILRDTVAAANEFNEPGQDFAAIGDVYGARRDLDQVEAMAAGENMAVDRARFVVRSNALTDGVTADDRIRVDGADWKITGNTRLSGARRRYREIAAVRRADG